MGSRPQGVVHAVIYDVDALTSPTSIFRGRGGDPLDWSSRLPDLSVFGMAADPALAADLWGGRQVGQLAIRNVASAFRIAVGRVALRHGFTRPQLPALSGLYRDSMEQLYSGLDIARSVLGSEAFSMAIDALGWIPVAGWIVEAIASVVQLVTGIVDAMGDRREDRARAELARIARLPLAQWSRGADEVLARSMMLQLEANDAQWIVSPRYPATAASDFKAMPQVVQPGDEQWAGWSVYTGGLGPGSEASPGLGFIPGTRNLHGAVELRTRGARDLRDLGEFYPTARLAAVQWWEMIVAGGPAMFSVNAEKARTAWADYLRSALTFGDNILSGWSMSKTAAKLGATSHKCRSGDYGAGECRKSKRGKTVPIVGTGHRSAYRSYLLNLFSPRRLDEGRGWEFENIDWDDTIPGRALANLQERQDATLRSLQCMTVDDSEIDGKPRFPAIGTRSRKGPLWSRWFESVKAVFATDDWRNVAFDDVPEGDLKRELRERCTAAGVACASLGQRHEAAFASKPSSLGDPVPPSPPEPTEFRFVFRPPRKTQPRTTSKIGVGTAVLAAGVLSSLFYLTGNSPPNPRNEKTP